MDFSHALTWITAMFSLKLPILEKIARPVIVYIVLTLLLRIFGKRELAQLNAFDLVVLLSLSNTVQNAIIGEDNSVTGGVISACSLLTINFFTARAFFRHPKLEAVMNGSPTRIITNGQVDRKAMERELLSDSDLLTVIRRQGFEGYDEVSNCTLEAGGAFYIRGIKPDADDRSQAELLGEFAKLQATIEELRNELRNRVRAG